MQTRGRVTSGTLLALLFLQACGTPRIAGPASPPPSAASPTTPSVAAASPPAAASDGAADLIFINGHIRTMDSDLPAAQAIAIRGERIFAVGTDTEVLATSAGNAAITDLQDHTLIAGFIDSHSHRIAQRYKWDLETIEQATQRALAEGWTSVGELAVAEGELAPYVEAAGRGGLGVRTNLYLTANTFSGDPLDPWYAAYQPGQELGPNLRVAGLKIFIDVNSGRQLLWHQADLDEFVRRRAAEGWQIAIKAIGINSHEMALTAFEGVLQGGTNDHNRFRIEHSLAVNDDQLMRMGRARIIAAIQPVFPGAVWHEEDIRLLTAEQGVDNIFRWPEYVEAGVVAAASPYNPDGFNAELTTPSFESPMGVLYRSVTQVGLDDRPPEPWMLTRALTVEQLLPMLTINGAYSMTQEHLVGSLTPGKLADMVLLSEDPVQIPPAALKDIRVLMTMVGGEVVYCATGAGAYCPPPRVAPPLAPTSPAASTDSDDITALAQLSASASLTGDPASNAVDGDPDTIWNSGDGPRQWLRFEFASPRVVSGVRLLVAQDPSGPTVHRIWAGTTEENVQQLREFAGTTTDGQWLEFAPASPTAPITILYVITTDSTSWVAWREVQIFGQ